MIRRSSWAVEVLDHRVEAELDAWPTELRARLTHIIERIQAVGLERLGEPLVKHITCKLWEMRASGKDVEGRAMYVSASGRRVVIVLAFVKKTRKTPPETIRTALERAKEVLR